MKGIVYLLFFVLISCNNLHTADEDDNNDLNDDINDNAAIDCEIDDGTHAATVDYYNPETGFSNTYTLNVEVQDCQVTIIYFDNGGYLDDSHIDAADIDDDGNATVEDDKGRSYDVHIDE